MQLLPPGHTHAFRACPGFWGERKVKSRSVRLPRVPNHHTPASNKYYPCAPMFPRATRVVILHVKWGPQGQMGPTVSRRYAAGCYACRGATRRGARGWSDSRSRGPGTTRAGRHTITQSMPRDCALSPSCGVQPSGSSLACRSRRARADASRSSHRGRQKWASSHSIRVLR